MNLSVAPLGLALPDQSQISNVSARSIYLAGCAQTSVCGTTAFYRDPLSRSRLRDGSIQYVFRPTGAQSPAHAARHDAIHSAMRACSDRGLAYLAQEANGIVCRAGRGGQQAFLACGLDPDRGTLAFINGGTRALLIRTDHVEVLPSGPPLGLDPTLRYLPMVTGLQAGDVLVALVNVGNEVEPELIDLVLTTRGTGPQRRWRSAMEHWAARVAGSTECDRALFMLERAGLIDAGGDAWSGECDSEIYESRARSGDLYLRFTLNMETGKPPASPTPIEGGTRE
jgi:hypothetical protein